jgi:3-deoxy-7-phosphoheptulonate synthase
VADERRQLAHLPVIVDPSHGTGIRSLVAPMAMAAIAAGAQGLIIEAQPDPDSAACDAFQTISPDELQNIHARMLAISALLGESSGLHVVEVEPVHLVA